MPRPGALARSAPVVSGRKSHVSAGLRPWRCARRHKSSPDWPETTLRAWLPSPGARLLHWRQVGRVVLYRPAPWGCLAAMAKKVFFMNYSLRVSLWPFATPLRASVAAVLSALSLAAVPTLASAQAPAARPGAAASAGAPIKLALIESHAVPAWLSRKNAIVDMPASAHTAIGDRRG